jgi:UrcA family protein
MLFRTIAAAAILALAATTAQAASPSSIDVAFGDLNLSSPADAKILAERLQAAAKTVCLNVNSDIKADEMQQCTDAAIDMAMAKIAFRLDQQVRANLVAGRAPLDNL